MDKEAVEREWTEAQLGSPFTPPADDIARVLFFNYWLNTGSFTSCEALHDRVHKENVGCPGAERLAQIHKECQGRIC